MDPDADPDPDIFVIDLQDANKKNNFLTKFFSANYFLKVHLHHKKSKRTVESKVFLTIFA
jgi:hypothetical protein